MKLDANNNSRIIYRIARSNLAGKKLYTFFSVLTITLSLTFVLTIMLFLQETQTAERRMLGQMQHVMYMNMTKQQMEQAAKDERIELLLPYKEGGEAFETDGVKYSFTYQKSQAEQIRTYVPAEGKEPERYDEIVVDRAFMEQLGKECKIGEKLTLTVGDRQEEFVLCGYTDRGRKLSVYPVYVSGEYADKGLPVREIPWTALVRIRDAGQMEASVFETVAYQIAADYGVRRSDVNINGRFQESLQEGNPIFQAMLLISLVILAAGGIVIYTIFYLSVTSRAQQIGQLQTIGMTEKQIRIMVRLEGFWLCAGSVPAALVLGGLIACFLEPEGWSLSGYLLTAAVTGIFGFLMVQISAGKPAAIAAKISPIEASRVVEEEDGNVRKNKKLTPFTMAQIGQGRNMKKQRLMTLSIAFGGILFMIAASYLYAWDEKAFSRTGDFADAEYVITYPYNAHSPLPYGLTGMQLTGHLGKELEEKLLAIPHVKSVKTEHGTFGTIEFQGASWVQGFYRLTENSEDFYRMEAEGNPDYGELCEKDALFITNNTFISQINGISFQVGDHITLHWFDGEEHETELEIAALAPGMVSSDRGYNVAMTDQTMKKLWGDMNTAVAFRISTEDYEEYGEQTEDAIRALTESFPDLALLTLRERMADDSADIRKVKTQIYGLSAFVVLFSVLNLVNLTIGNIATRRKEFAVLEAIGMEERQIRAMLFWENVLLVLPAILITLAIGGGTGYVVVSLLRRIAGYMVYRIPVIPALLFAAGVILIPLLISYVSLKGIHQSQYNQGA